MRTSLCVIASLGSGLAGALALAAGCGTVPDDCQARLNCTPSVTTGSGGGTINTLPECVPSENKLPIDESCGVFVSASRGEDGAASGAKVTPFKTLGAALSKARATTRRVYACAESFSEAAVIDGAVEIYGGLDCNKGWLYVGATTKTSLTAQPAKVPLTLTKNTQGAKVLDVAVTAADAPAMSAGSSIAVIADHAGVSFVRCDIKAGSGDAGLAGQTPMTPIGPADDSPGSGEIKGYDGTKACTDTGGTPTAGGAQKKNMYCGDGDDSPIGGYGGNGTVPQGGDGDSQTMSVTTAFGGKGQVDATWSCATIGQGKPGIDGAVGEPGSGAKGDAIGTIDGSGYKGAPGAAGAGGKPGQGGGGGGGAKGKAGCFGASGGGGGTGGCGGNGGGGGGAGGASIAIVSVSAQLAFDTVNISVGHGGAGGNGASGQQGARGGNGGIGGSGNGTSPACNGGNGGNGGTGGGGGGGRGGHAIGIAYSGGTPDTKGVMFLDKGAPGAGGKGAAPSGNNGDPGLHVEVQKFP